MFSCGPKTLVSHMVLIPSASYKIEAPHDRGTLAQLNSTAECTRAHAHGSSCQKLSHIWKHAKAWPYAKSKTCGPWKLLKLYQRYSNQKLGDLLGFSCFFMFVNSIFGVLILPKWLMKIPGPIAILFG